MLHAGARRSYICLLECSAYAVRVVKCVKDDTVTCYMGLCCCHNIVVKSVTRYSCYCKHVQGGPISSVCIVVRVLLCVVCGA
jgi:hypothetical protein